MMMKARSLLACLMSVLAITPVIKARSETNSVQKIRRTVDAASVTRQRLARSLATIQEVYEFTQKPETIRRRHLWLVGEALPWRSTLQPSCLRERGYDLKQIPETWPVAADAPALRSLLTDEVPGIRALAVEALATLHQGEDVSHLAALVTDAAEAPIELVAPVVGQQASFEDIIGPGPDAVTRYMWHKSTVANHAAWALAVMLGDCCPSTISDLQFTRFLYLDSYALTHPPTIDHDALARLAAGDPKEHLWYWQEYIHRALHQVDEAADGVIGTKTPGIETLDWNERLKMLHTEKHRAKEAWIGSFTAEMRSWPVERRAMVRLLASDPHQGGADMAYYDTPHHMLFNCPLNLGLEKGRILELLDGIGLWPDERRDRGGRSQVVERLALGWRECLNSEDISRLLALFSHSKDDLWWSARAALLVALANLMPASGTASDDPSTAEGFLRRTLKKDPDVFIRKRAASELMRMNPDVHWPLLTERFFADRDNGDDLPLHILEWLKQSPAGEGPTRKLLALVSDDRFRPLWIEPERPSGKFTQGGRCRRMAAAALNARLGNPLVTDEDLTTLKDPEKGPARLRLILERVHEIGKP